MQDNKNNKKKEFIYVTDLTNYLYCPRKVYLQKVKHLREPANQNIIKGRMKHAIFDSFNKSEQNIVSQITTQLSQEELFGFYKKNFLELTKKTFSEYEKLASLFGISFEDFWKETQRYFNREIILRVKAISKLLEKKIFGAELWKKLEPKYLTELRIISDKLALIGRVDRIKLEQGNYIPYEIKSRKILTSVPYDNELLQIAAYSLLLEEKFSFPVKKGFIEYSNKKVAIEMTTELREKVLYLLDKIKNLHAQDIPQIEKNFSKCKSCGLRKICFKL